MPYEVGERDRPTSHLAPQVIRRHKPPKPHGANGVAAGPGSLLGVRWRFLRDTGAEGISNMTDFTHGYQPSSTDATVDQFGLDEDAYLPPSSYPVPLGLTPQPQASHWPQQPIHTPSYPGSKPSTASALPSKPGTASGNSVSFAAAPLGATGRGPSALAGTRNPSPASVLRPSAPVSSSSSLTSLANPHTDAKKDGHESEDDDAAAYERAMGAAERAHSPVILWRSSARVKLASDIPAELRSVFLNAAASSGTTEQPTANTVCKAFTLALCRGHPTLLSRTCCACPSSFELPLAHRRLVAVS
jgi:hypothetical protein